MILSHFPLFAGAMVGFSIAVPLGPMGLLCIQRTLAGGMCVGVCTGLGAATVNVIYGMFILIGLHRLAPLLASEDRLLSFAGGAFLLWCAARTLLRKRSLPGPASAPGMSPLIAYASALAFNIANPLSPILMLALLSPVLGASGPSLGDAVMLLLGIFMAATTWWVCLSGGITLLRSQLSPGLLVAVNRVAGALLTFYGAVALARSISM